MRVEAGESPGRQGEEGEGVVQEEVPAVFVGRRWSAMDQFWPCLMAEHPSGLVEVLRYHWPSREER